MTIWWWLFCFPKWDKWYFACYSDSELFSYKEAKRFETFIKMQPLTENAVNIPAFLSKLWKMVNDPGTDHLICWSPVSDYFTMEYFRCKWGYVSLRIDTFLWHSIWTEGYFKEFILKWLANSGFLLAGWKKFLYSKSSTVLVRIATALLQAQ